MSRAGGGGRSYEFGGRITGAAASAVAHRRPDLLDAHLAATDARSQVAGLHRLRLRRVKLLLRVDGRQPEAELVGEVVTSAASAVALDERRRAEIFQTRAGTGQRLAASFRPGRRVLATQNTTSSPITGLHGNGESGNTAVTTVITAGSAKISR